MKSIGRNIARALLAFAAMTGCGLAQQAVPEKHVKDIQAEQTQEAIFASPLCQRTREHRPFVYHERKVDLATLQPDLKSLMEQSDEVVLGGIATNYTVAISPSGEDVVRYFDVTILRSWKGSHKIGDTLTFAIPSTVLYCTPMPPGPDGTAEFRTTTRDYRGYNYGPHILFLRQSRDDETQLTPGLRMAGGDGLQGAFFISIPVPYGDYGTCDGALHGSVEKCRELLRTSQVPISVRYRRDPLFQKYDGMPTSLFLQEVESVANSLGYVEQIPSSK